MTDAFHNMVSRKHPNGGTIAAALQYAGKETIPSGIGGGNK